MITELPRIILISMLVWALLSRNRDEELKALAAFTGGALVVFLHSI
jgi:hypothetical protein